MEEQKQPQQDNDPFRPVKKSWLRRHQIAGYFFVGLCLAVGLIFYFKMQIYQQLAGALNIPIHQTKPTSETNHDILISQTKHPGYNGYIKWGGGCGDYSCLFLVSAGHEPTLFLGKFAHKDYSQARYNKGRIYYVQYFYDNQTPPDKGYEIRYGHMQVAIGYYDIINQKDVKLADLVADPASYGFEIRGNIEVVDNNVYFLLCDQVPNTQGGVPDQKGCKFNKVDIETKTLQTIKDMSGLPVFDFYYYSREENLALIEGQNTIYKIDMSNFQMSTVNNKADIDSLVDALNVESQKADAKNCGVRPGTFYDFSILGCFFSSEIPIMPIEKGIVHGSIKLGQLQVDRKLSIITKPPLSSGVIGGETFTGKYSYELPPGQYVISLNKVNTGTDPLHSKEFTIESGKDVVVDFNIP